MGATVLGTDGVLDSGLDLRMHRARTYARSLHTWLELTTLAARRGADHPEVVEGRRALARLWVALADTHAADAAAEDADQDGQDRMLAESLYQAALVVQETLEPDHPDMAETLEHYADLLRRLGRHFTASDLSARARGIRAARRRSPPRTAAATPR